ncbi:MAG: hypothetical protein WB697_09740 [Stellaceae bacterium]
MTDIMIGVHALTGIVAAGAFLIVFYWPWQCVWADVARQVVFEKRDAIFDLALAGGISFNSREYRAIRVALEQIIRFAHAGTLPRILVAGFSIWWHGPMPTRAPIENVIDRVNNPETREAIRKLVKSATRTVAVTMAVRSLPVILLFPVTIVVICFLVLCRNAARALARIMGVVILVESAADASEGRAPRAPAAA